jgi:hypothetical protein
VVDLVCVSYTAVGRTLAKKGLPKLETLRLLTRVSKITLVHFLTYVKM